MKLTNHNIGLDKPINQSLRRPFKPTLLALSLLGAFSIHANAGNVHIVDIDSQANVSWQTPANSKAQQISRLAGDPVTTTNSLALDQQLNIYDSLYSSNGQYRLTLQSDANLVLYDASSNPMWASNSDGSGGIKARFQGDGNFLIRTSSGSVPWKTNTHNQGADRLVLNNNGSLVMYAGDTVIWNVGNPPPAENTGGGNNGDIVPPVLTLNGYQTMSINIGDTFVDPGATASDDTDGNISSAIVATSNVNTNVADSYFITYSVTDAAGNSAQTINRVVHVVNSDDSHSSLGDRFLLNQAMYTNQYIASPNGEYRLTLQANGDLALTNNTGSTTLWRSYTTNQNGNMVKFQGDANFLIRNTSGSSIWSTGTNGSNADRLVLQDNGALVMYAGTTVVWNVGNDIEAPQLSLNGSTYMEVEAGESFAEPGAVANDNADGDISDSIVRSGAVDTSIPGDYLLKYDVKDKMGNQAPQQTRLLRSLIPVDNTNATHQLGNGYDSIEGKLKSTTAVYVQSAAGVGESVALGNTSAHYSYHVDLNQTQIINHISGNASADVSYGAVEASGNIALAIDTAADDFVSTYTLFARVKPRKMVLASQEVATYGHSADQVAGTGTGLSATSSFTAFADVSSTVEILKDRVGNEYIEAIELGSWVMVTLKLSFASAQDKKDIGGRLAVDWLDTVSVEGEANYSDIEGAESVKISLIARQYGGDVQDLAVIVPSNIGECTLAAPEACTDVFENAANYLSNGYRAQFVDANGDIDLSKFNPVRYYTARYDNSGPELAAYFDSPLDSLTFESKQQLQQLYNRWQQAQLDKRRASELLLKRANELSDGQKDLLEFIEIYASENSLNLGNEVKNCLSGAKDYCETAWDNQQYFKSYDRKALSF